MISELLFYFSGVSIAFIVFQLLFPYKPKNDADFALLKHNARKYNRLEAWAIFWLFLFVAYIAFCVAFLGSQMQNYFFPKDYVYLIQPTLTFWFLPGIILGFGLVGVPMEFLYKLILKNEYYLYLEFTNIKHGWDGKKIWKPLSILLVVTGSIVFYLGLTWYVRINDQNRIEINDLTSLNTVTYNLDEIADLRYSEKYFSEKGKEKSIPHYRIVLNDGTFYSTHLYGFFSIKEDREKLLKNMEELSTTIGVAIQGFDSIQ